MFQSLANHLIGAQQIVRRDTLTVWRVGYHDTLVLGLGKVLEVLLLNGHIACQSGSLDIQAGCINSLDIHVIAIDVMIEFAFLRIVVVYGVEKLTDEVGPFLEGIFLAEQAWCHIAGDESSLDEQGARATHGVDKVGFAMPAGHQNHTCCQNLIQWRLDRFLTIAATMQ